MAFDREVKSFTLDPFFEIADANVESNHWPRKHTRPRLGLFKNSAGKILMEKTGESMNYSNN